MTLSLGLKLFLAHFLFGSFKYYKAGITPSATGPTTASQITTASGFLMLKSSVSGPCLTICSGNSRREEELCTQ